MINHARTLLINKSSTDMPPVDVNGSEYVDPTFKPVYESEFVKQSKAVLFGTNPDALTLNYRVQQYLQLLHGNSLFAEYVTSLDPRVTYLSGDYWFDYTLDKLGITHVKSDTGALDAFGNAVSFDERGYNLFNYKLEVLTGDANRLVRVTLALPEIQQFYYLINTAGCSLIELPGSRSGESLGILCRLRFPGGLNEVQVGQLGLTDATSWISINTLATVTDMWLMTYAAKPDRGLDEILENLNRRVPPFDSQLAATEPFQTFQYLRTHGENTIRKLSGYLLACIYSNNLNV